ncbi:MAG TPA: bifunctional (p)ppGpp synthetase/guanosine-3',5'-bis(diphosphate) 3'-pyrophosphohydrolase [Bacteroidales bacterium]|nr:bifunctional (p)ppGpp synthetase/guanosine-3',5'-bis(diphosphate) 3'-pyrophosphohydrolase [Bacteroidales bacterium]
MYIIDEELERRDILKRYKHLIQLISQSASQEEKRQVRRAFTVARKAHEGVRRKTGEPYIIHPMEVARIAAEDLGLGPVAVVCALLHDVVEDTEYTLEDIRMIFDDRVAQIIDGLTKIEGVFDYATNSIQAENFKKLLTTMGDDVRVILLKLCDRLHNMRTLESMREDKQLKIASETQMLYVPLAHRLGLYQIKSELEDLSTQYINPQGYQEIVEKLKDSEEVRNKFIKEFAEPIEKELRNKGYKFTVTARVKTITSIIGKIENKGVLFDEIYDIFAIRVVLDVPVEIEKESCFAAYSLINTIYGEQKHDRLRDWISKPKTNGYEALHFTVQANNGRWVEVQIRSQRMDEIAEKGLAAHYKYKEVKEGELDEKLDNWLGKVRELLDNQSDNAIDFVNDFKLNLVIDEITTFTPIGKIITLPKGSTVLDFAFNVHTQLGINCMGAKVNYKVVTLNHELKPSDQVEIITSKISYPKEEYLSFVKTSRAVQGIKNYLRDYRKGFYEEGLEKLEKIYLELGIEFSNENIDKLSKYVGLPQLIDFYYKVAKEDITIEDVRLCFDKRKSKNSTWMFLRNPFLTRRDKDGDKLTLNEEIKKQIENNPEQVVIQQNMENLKYVTAPCCRPVPGDDIVGLIRESSIEVHRTSCIKAIDEMSKFGHRIIKAKWRENEKITFLAGIKVKGIDRRGLLQELTGVVSEGWNINIRGLAVESSEGLFEGTIMVYIYDAEQLNKLIKNIEGVDGIQSVRRI